MTIADRRELESGSSEPRTKRVSYDRLIEEYLADATFSDNPRLGNLVSAMRRSLLAKGERLHSRLCIEAANAFGLDAAEVLPVAAAIEYLHTLAWIHGSLPAVTGERRGARATCHEEFGEAAAILADDGYLGESLLLITTEQKGTPEQIVQVVRELARVTGASGMIAGRVLQACYAELTPDSETLDALQAHGTGSLLEASARVGAILAAASPVDCDAAALYARRLGLCLRIVDDLLNSASKVRQPDAAVQPERESMTFTGVYGLPGARRLADRALREALEALDDASGNVAGLAALAFSVRRGEHSAYPGPLTQSAP